MRALPIIWKCTRIICMVCCGNLQRVASLYLSRLTKRPAFVPKLGMAACVAVVCVSLRFDMISFPILSYESILQLYRRLRTAVMKSNFSVFLFGLMKGRTSTIQFHQPSTLRCCITMRVELISHCKPCMTEVYLHI